MDFDGTKGPDRRNASLASYTHRAIISGFLHKLERCDPYTRGHSQFVQRGSKLLAQALGWKPSLVEYAGAGGLLHDIGKTRINLNLVRSRSNALTERQRVEIKRHPILGEELIRDLFPLEVRHAVRHHHERLDGSGYPDGLRGEEISPAARAVAIVDSFHSMVSQREYNKPVPVVVACNSLLEGAGKQYDPKFVETFIQNVVPQLHAADSRPTLSV